MRGDPTWAGPLAGIALGYPVYHVMEPDIKAQVDESVYDAEVAIMEGVIEEEEINTVLEHCRADLTSS
jgi:glycine reductase